MVADTMAVARPPLCQGASEVFFGSPYVLPPELFYWNTWVRKMTGYTVHTGASKKFVSGWDRVFGSEQKAETGSSSLNKSTGKNKTEKQSGKAGKKKKS